MIIGNWVPQPPFSSRLAMVENHAFRNDGVPIVKLFSPTRRARAMNLSLHVDILWLDRPVRLVHDPVNHALEECVANLLAPHVDDYALAHPLWKICCLSASLTNDVPHQPISALSAADVVVLDVYGQLQWLTG